MLPPTKRSFKRPPGELIIAHDDPVVIALNSLIKTCHHFNKKHLGLRHVKIMSGVETACRVLKRTDVTMDYICQFVGLLPEDFHDVMTDLIEKKYVHEVVPAFGESSYRLGSLGATVLRGLIKGLTKPGHTPSPKVS